MTEQREQKQGKSEVSRDPVGTIDTINNGIKWINSKPGRRIVGVGVWVGLGISAALAGCAKGSDQTPTNTTGVVSTTTTSETTPTTESVTATGTTTTTENGSDISPALLSKKTIEDVKNSVTPTGKEITTPINVSGELQKEFEALFPGQDQKILYIGSHNNGPKDSLVGNQLNDSLVTVGGQASKDESNFKFLNYGGTYPQKQEIKKEDGQVETITVFPEIAGEVAGIVPCTEPAGTKDYYVELTDPTNNNEEMFVRIVRDANSRFNQTVFQCFDLNNPDGFDIDTPIADTSGKYLAANIPVDGFISIGETLEISTDGTASGTGNIQKVIFSIDENGKQTAREAAVIRLVGAPNINALFK